MVTGDHIKSIRLSNKNKVVFKDCNTAEAHGGSITRHLLPHTLFHGGVDFAYTSDGYQNSSWIHFADGEIVIFCSSQRSVLEVRCPEVCFFESVK